MNASPKPSSRKARARPADVRIVLRAPQAALRVRETTSPRKLIKPIERGFAVLEAFTADDAWLANQAIAARTGIPKATVSRLMQTLTGLGYLIHSKSLGKYRLASAVLGLGYAAMADAEVVAVARPLMQSFADDHGVFIALAGRDGLDMILSEVCHSSSALATVGLGVGEHMPIAASPLGWALLAGLPASERGYLLDHIRARNTRTEWMRLRQCITDAVQQTSVKGYCASTGTWGPNITTVAVPLNIQERLPMALVCAALPRTRPKAKLDEQLGQKLAKLVHRVRERTEVAGHG